MSFTYLPQTLSNDLISSQPESKSQTSRQTKSILKNSSTDSPSENQEKTSNKASTQTYKEAISEASRILNENSEKAWNNQDYAAYQHGLFLLGQLYYESNQFTDSFEIFKKLVDTSTQIESPEFKNTIYVAQAKYQLSILGFDKKLIEPNTAFLDLENLLSEINNLNNEETGDNFSCKMSSDNIKLFKIIANYNLGLATFNGFNPHIRSGQIFETTRQYWINSAGGNIQTLSSPTNVKASDIFRSLVLKDQNLIDQEKSNWHKSKQVSDIKFYQALAQSKLGMLFSLKSDFTDHEKSFFWHTEAAGNGSVESQGALGVMYLNGIGTRKNEKSGLYCLKQAADCNNLYALGRLCEYYYKLKLFGHCLAYSKSYAVKFLHENKNNLIQSISNQANKAYVTPLFAIKGAVLCAYFFARLMEDGIYEKIALKNKSVEELDDTDIILSTTQSAVLSIYKNCAKVEPQLMIELQEQRRFEMV